MPVRTVHFIAAMSSNVARNFAEIDKKWKRFENRQMEWLDDEGAMVRYANRYVDMQGHRGGKLFIIGNGDCVRELDQMISLCRYVDREVVWV